MLELVENQKSSRPIALAGLTCSASGTCACPLLVDEAASGSHVILVTLILCRCVVLYFDIHRV